MVQEQFCRGDSTPDQLAPGFGAFTERLPHTLVYLSPQINKEQNKTSKDTHSPGKKDNQVGTASTRFTPSMGCVFGFCSVMVKLVICPSAMFAPTL